MQAVLIEFRQVNGVITSMGGSAGDEAAVNGLNHGITFVAVDIVPGPGFGPEMIAPAVEPAEMVFPMRHTGGTGVADHGESEVFGLDYGPAPVIAGIGVEISGPFMIPAAVELDYEQIVIITFVTLRSSGNGEAKNWTITVTPVNEDAGSYIMSIA